MIPQRIQLQGFLCYKDPQEVAFDGGSLWLLAGLNGSGKSAIFDGLTYALFGHHRGGQRYAEELINKDSDRLQVEFDFTLDGHAYRARRTLKRGAGGNRSTQQIYRREPGSDGQGKWAPVEGTGSSAGFKKWVGESVGLDYEPFTSSVLLLQGRAEKLLDSTDKGRFEVLAGIVDLERYQRLHKQADEQRKELDKKVDLLQTRLSDVPEVDEFQLADADDRTAAAETARQQAQNEIERLKDLENQAGQWADLQARLANAHQRWQQARQLLCDAQKIRQDLERLHELQKVMPHLRTVVEERRRAADAEQKIGELQVKRHKLAEQLDGFNDKLELSRQQRQSLLKRVEAEELRHREVAADFRQAATRVEKLKEYERQETDLARLLAELKELPADPAAEVRQAREAHDRLADLARTVPLLGRLHQQREQLREALKRVQEAEDNRRTTHRHGEEVKQQVAQLTAEAELATKGLQKAGEKATEAATLLKQARQDLQQLSRLDGEKRCSLCGQDLTEEHVQEEKVRRQTIVDQAEAKAKRTAADHQTAKEHEKKVRARLVVATRELEEARARYLEGTHVLNQAGKDVERLRGDCGQTYHELPEPFRVRISPEPPDDWLATVYPTVDEVGAATKEASGLSAARRLLHLAEEIQLKWGGLKAREAGIRETLQRLAADLPGDRQGLRVQFSRLETEEKTLEESLRAQRKAAQDVQNEIDRIGKQREQAQQQATEIAGQVRLEETTRQQSQQALARARKELPASWQAAAKHPGLADLHGWLSELDKLINQKTEERAGQLQQAQANLEVLCRDKEELEKKQEQFPAEARQDPAAIRALLAGARAEYKARNEEWSEARQQKALLEAQRRQRHELQQELLRVERDANHARLLAELLGRDRLQLHLVRQAERQVVDQANLVLDRLSGGQLHLRLCGEAGGEGNSAKALELEVVNRTTGDKPINVAFLSGSQKFRVAVSLALGIGQYASRQHRPIESVIIDEGFGCLDRHGRQVMIQELLNLRGQMRCILLVSHQEEFAEAFADGYHFELVNGTTKATRFQR